MYVCIQTASWVQDTKNNWIDWPMHTLTPTLKLVT